MTGRFGSHTSPTAKAPPKGVKPGATDPSNSKPGPFEKEVEIYPAAVRLLWQFFRPEDRGKEEGTPQEYSGAITQEVQACIDELSQLELIEVTSSFEGSGVAAKLTKLGLAVMADQPVRDDLRPVRVADPVTTRVTVYHKIDLGV